MANPLQPKCVKILVSEYEAYVINITAASRAGHMDIVCCIKGEFWGFEIKWKNDQPSIAQKEKLNKCIEAGGRAFFIRSVEDLRHAISSRIPPVKYAIKSQYVL